MVNRGFRLLPGWRRALACVAAAVALAGCGAQYIRDAAQTDIQAGRYEKGLKALDDAAATHPDNLTLLAGQAKAHEAVDNRLIGEASSARAAGNYDAAAQALNHALAINSGNQRASAMLLDIERDRREKETVDEAKKLISKGLREQAALAIEGGLKDNPNHAELLALQRELELSTRREEASAMRLAETRPVTLDFRDANLRMVLDVLTRNSGVNFVIDKDVRPDMQATVFLRQTRLEDALALITSTNQLAYKVLDPSTVLVYPKTQEKEREYQDLVIRAFYLNSADAKQTATMLKTMLKVREPFVDEKLNMVMLRETPETIRLAERMIALQDMAEPEVMMDVQVLEVTTSLLNNLGISYPESVTLTPIAPTGGFTLGNVRSINRDTIGMTTPTVTLNFQHQTGEANILARPKIRARNREKAKILIGDKLPVVTTTATGGGGTAGFISESVQYVDVGLKLEVEPNVYLDDEVAIKIGLEVSSLAQEIHTAAGSIVYQIGTRNANTLLQLKDGETQILAGLINTQERNSASRIPGLGDLPVLGRLFASHNDNDQKTEIVLAITPHIVRNIRRPDLNLAEFWSGTENNVRSRPLALPKKTADAKPGGIPAAQGAAGVPEGNPAAAESPVKLSLMGPEDVKKGETFDVAINIKSAAPIRGMPVKLQFDPQHLRPVDAQEGDFLKQQDAKVSISKNLEAENGMATLAVLRNSVEGAGGEGMLCTVKFKALDVGESDIRLVWANPVAAQPMLPPELPKTLHVSVK